MQIGDRFGRLVVLELIPHGKNPKARCMCDCGNQCSPQRGSLRNGRAKSCGCLGKENLLASITSHGKSKTSLYRTWTGIHQRCENPQNPSYKNYGGRGIYVDASWKTFDQFAKDMGECPKGRTLERKDTNGPYSKENCEWGSWTDQATNKRVSKRWMINGKEYISSVQAAKELGVTPSVIIRRTNGFKRGDKEYAPVPGYYSRLVYE